MNEKRRLHAALDIAKPLQNFRPSIHSVGIGTPQGDSKFRVLRRNRRPIALPRKYVRAGHKPFQILDGKFAVANFVPRQHRLDCRRVTLRQPKPLRVFVHNENVSVAVATAEQDDRVMRETVIQRGEPFHRPRIVEILDDVNLTPQRREVLAGGDVPIPVQPRAFLPAGEIFQHADVFGIVPFVIRDPRRDEARFSLALFLKWHDEFRPIPAVTNTAGICCRINARTEIRFARPAAG